MPDEPRGAQESRDDALARYSEALDLLAGDDAASRAFQWETSRLKVDWLDARGRALDAASAWEFCRDGSEWSVDLFAVPVVGYDTALATLHMVPGAWGDFCARIATFAVTPGATATYISPYPVPAERGATMAPDDLAILCRALTNVVLRGDQAKFRELMVNRWDCPDPAAAKAVAERAPTAPPVTGIVSWLLVGVRVCPRDLGLPNPNRVATRYPFGTVDGAEELSADEDPSASFMRDMWSLSRRTGVALNVSLPLRGWENAMLGVAALRIWHGMGWAYALKTGRELPEPDMMHLALDDASSAILVASTKDGVSNGGTTIPYSWVPRRDVPKLIEDLKAVCGRVTVHGDPAAVRTMVDAAIARL